MLHAARHDILLSSGKAPSNSVRPIRRKTRVKGAVAVGMSAGLCQSSLVQQSMLLLRHRALVPVARLASSLELRVKGLGPQAPKGSQNHVYKTSVSVRKAKANPKPSTPAMDVFREVVSSWVSLTGLEDFL